jgi:hypothetical protein
MSCHESPELVVSGLSCRYTVLGKADREICGVEAASYAVCHISQKGTDQETVRDREKGPWI